MTGAEPHEGGPPGEPSADDPAGPPVAAAGRSGALSPAESARAARRWWDADAQRYHVLHGRFLGEADFVWCPERLREEDARLLGSPESLVGARVLEIGAGSGMCSRWLAAHGADPIASDISMGMLAHGRRAAGPPVPMVQADAQSLPFAGETFEIVFTAYGAVPFAADTAAIMREAARVLRPGGRFVFAVTHPIRWAFPDDPGPDGLVASIPYFDRRAYVERDCDGAPIYAEQHRTLGDRVREITAAGLILVDLIEPEWPADLAESWGQWSPLRGAILPGTAIYDCRKPPA
ncbi:MAG: class I SAM-dependent methyltransferase [Frankiaceae bacterium]|jgi:SAM-dependent methyltransferase|nr:class I SAM-dependent methyltransferase [Frankiaceae bacterium]